MVIREVPIFVLSHKNSTAFEGEGQMVRGGWGCIKYEKTLPIIGLVTEGINQHPYLAVSILPAKYATVKDTLFLLKVKSLVFFAI